METTIESESSVDPNDEAQKILAYIMPDRGAKGAPGHKFMVLRRTTKNAKSRYVTGDEFGKFGLFWPNSLVRTREELALLIGEAILDEAGVFKRPRQVTVICDYETSARVGAMGTFQVIGLEEDGNDVTDLVDQGVHFESLDALKRYLERATGDEFFLMETGESPQTETLSVTPTADDIIERAIRDDKVHGVWDQDSHVYGIGLRKGPEGAVWADKAIAARPTSKAKAFAYAKKALAVRTPAWSLWYGAFTGLPTR